MKKPKAILISDIHYNLKTMHVADEAVRRAIVLSNNFKVPLIVCGDTHDSKANIRAECMNAMIETFALADMQPWVLVGNHDKVNEKSQEHALNFFGGIAVIVDQPKYYSDLGINFIPYQHDPKFFKKCLIKDAINIVHQGLSGSNSGEYIQDKSAVLIKDVAGHRIISGHYHTRQTIKLPKSGQWDYVGNPYTLTFAEANDPAKGFQILYDDGSLEFVSTNLRRHVILNVEQSNDDAWQITGKIPLEDVRDRDIVWVKMKGSKEQLANKTKDHVSKMLYPLKNFKLDLIPTTSEVSKVKTIHKTKPDQLDAIIDGLTDVSEERKLALKDKWKGL